MELFFLIGGVWVFLKYIDSGRLRWLFLSCVLFLLSLLSYYPAFVTVPLITFLLGVVYVSRERRLVLVPFVVCSVTLALFLLTQSTDRISQITFIGHESQISLLFERRTEAGMAGAPILLTRVVHNIYTVAAFEFLGRYLDHFSLRFLFVDGEVVDARYDVPYHGPIYFALLPFLMTGLCLSILKTEIEWREKIIILSWIVIAFVPGAMTTESTSLQRSFLAINGFVILISVGLAYGINQISSLKKRIRLLIVGFSVAVTLASFVYYSYSLFVHYPFRRPWGRDGHVEEMLVKVRAHEKRYKKVYISKPPYISMFFFDKSDPDWARKTVGHNLEKNGAFFYLSKFGDYFGMPVDCPRKGKRNILFVCKGAYVPYRSRVIDVVRFKDEVPAYVLIEFTTDDGYDFNNKGFRIVNMDNNLDRQSVLDDDHQTDWE